ncbi:putative bifunctional diguanylate cyclase/phosphodiesterase [Sulfurimonas aquatica]|nr:EAL domain-containing protein [Sulfurimonas aquatica]
MLSIILVSVYAIFIKNYEEQREKTANLILNTIKDDVSEVSYLLSKSIKNNEKINKYRAILDRTTSNNSFVSTIMVIDGSEVLITTNPHNNTAPRKADLYYDKSLTDFEYLSTQKGLEGRIRYYQGSTLHELEIVFLFDSDEIKELFNETKLSFFFYFGLFPIVLLYLSWTIIKYSIVKPLEKLRAYAYHQSDIPKKLYIHEMEAIRSSMVQTFSRLDREQKELYKMARTDILSGLANRVSLKEYLERLILDSDYDKKEFAFLFLDLDHFKSVNDELGHLVGDELLTVVSSRVQELLPENSFIARVGGDEFVIILHNYASLTSLTSLMDQLQGCIANQWIIQSHPIHITSSIGIAFYPKDARDLTTLMQHSNVAMYEAKKKGRAQYHFYTEVLNKKVQNTIALDKDMRKALENKEYELYYQPKTDVESGRIIGAEALIRWNSPDRGFVGPNVFIPLAEENGFIIELGNWVLQEAVNQQLEWKQKGMDITISVNVATKQLLDNAFEYVFTSIMDMSGVDPSKIDIEITEYLFLKETQKSLRVLNMIHDYGSTISLDDFGTGYSSLSYLKRFPIDNLKIDKVFMDDYATEDGAVFVETIVKMGQTLKLHVIAEGIEEKEQVEYLSSIGCVAYQGYYCSKPLNVNEFEKFYKAYLTL